jgi:HlyD family secretion protein
MSRRILVFAVLLVAIIGAVWAWSRRAPPGPVGWQGYAEADFVKVGPTQAGLVTAIKVGRGDRVVKGAPLFDQDDTADRAAVAAADQAVAQAQAQLENLQAAARTTEIAQAQANLNEATASRDKTLSDLRRNLALLDKGAATQQVVDQQQADVKSSDAHIEALKAQIDQLKAPVGRPLEIAAQAAAVDAAKANLEQARWRLSQRSVVSPAGALVADVVAQPGETLAAGAPVVSLLPPENVFVRFFVPEPSLSSVKVGDVVGLACDNCPPDLKGTVSFVSPRAEYTPPFIFSESTRSKFVFLAEARANRGELGLNPGQPVTVTPEGAL